MLFRVLISFLLIAPFAAADEYWLLASTLHDKPAYGMAVSVQDILVTAVAHDNGVYSTNRVWPYDAPIDDVELYDGFHQRGHEWSVFTGYNPMLD